VLISQGTISVARRGTKKDHLMGLDATRTLIGGPVLICDYEKAE
jgi:hypothetical protein